MCVRASGGSAYGCNVPIISEVGEYEGSPFFRACSVRACVWRDEAQRMVVVFLFLQTLAGGTHCNVVK